jgi:hypothetical protein
MSAGIVGTGGSSFRPTLLVLRKYELRRALDLETHLIVCLRHGLGARARLAKARDADGRGPRQEQTGTRQRRRAVRKVKHRLAPCLRFSAFSRVSGVGPLCVICFLPNVYSTEISRGGYRFSRDHATARKKGHSRGDSSSCCEVRGCVVLYVGHLLGRKGHNLFSTLYHCQYHRSYCCLRLIINTEFVYCTPILSFSGRFIHRLPTDTFGAGLPAYRHRLLAANRTTSSLISTPILGVLLRGTSHCVRAHAAYWCFLR